MQIEKRPNLTANFRVVLIDLYLSFIFEQISCSKLFCSWIIYGKFEFD